MPTILETLVDRLENNCGTGAGGFKAGNTCSKSSLTHEGKGLYVGVYKSPGGRKFDVELTKTDATSAKVNYLRGRGAGTGTFKDVLKEFANDVRSLGVKTITFSTASDEVTGGKSRERLFQKYLKLVENTGPIMEFLTNAREIAWNNCGTGKGGFKGGNKCALGGKGNNRTPTPKLSGLSKSEMAKATTPKVKSEKQRYSEEFNEPVLAKLVKGFALKNNEPADIVKTKGGKTLYGLELKTIIHGKERRVYMGSKARKLKAAWEKQNKAKIHLVVFDDAGVYNAKGKGKHDVSKRRIFYKRNGIGSPRLNSMYEVKSYAELKRLVESPTNKLPKGAL